MENAIISTWLGRTAWTRHENPRDEIPLRTIGLGDSPSRGRARRAQARGIAGACRIFAKPTWAWILAFTSPRDEHNVGIERARMSLALDSSYACRECSCSVANMSPCLHHRRPNVRKSRGRGLRTKNGCITCRKRHLKCDEVKPVCGPCTTKNKSCEYAALDRRSTNFSTSTNNINDNAPVPESPHIPSPENTDHATGAVTPDLVPNESHQATSYVWTSSEANVNRSPQALLDHLPSNELGVGQSPLTFQHSYLSPSNASSAAVRWFGLLASDAARESPRISPFPNSYTTQTLATHHSSTEGVTQPTALQYATQVLDIPPASNAADASDSYSPLEEEQIWKSREPIDLLPVEQTLFRHFVHHVGPWIDLFDPTSQFSTFVAHLAVHNAGLMNAILALAFRHLALNSRLDNGTMPNKEESALQYYYQTLHYVQKAMQYSSYKTSLELLATTLIISAYEMLDNSTNGWERHLEGVFLIQRSQTIHGESGGLHSAVWWAWLCQDLWAAFREKRKTFTFWVPQKPLTALSPHELATRVMYITAKVISYCADSSSEENIQSRMDEASRLHTMLEDWRRHLSIEFSPLPLGSCEPSYFSPIWIRPPAFAVAVQFSRASQVLLLAHQPSLGGLDQYLGQRKMISRCIADICGIARTLQDTASSLMSSQALFIAGIFAQENKAREAILDLLEVCRERCGWPIKSLGAELKQLWDNTDTTKPTAEADVFL